MDMVAPEKVGMSASRLRRIRPMVERYVDDGKIAGALTLIARRGGAVHQECFGMMDLQAGTPMRDDAIFRIYSMTKPITSLALMMLYEEGLVRLNDPVSRFIPAFADLRVFRYQDVEGIQTAGLQRPITVRDLLTHTAGLSYGFETIPVDLMYQKAQLFQENRTLKDFVAELVKLPLIHQPGTVWRYSVAIDVVGHLIELISGLSLDQFFQERIFKPLGMVDTAFSVPANKSERLTTLYEYKPEGHLEAIDSPADSSYAQRKTLFSGGGGLVSTAADYLRFAQMMLNGGVLNGERLVSRKTVELMMMNHLPAEALPFGAPLPIPGAGFGLGGLVLMDVAQDGNLGSVGTYGWGGAASTMFWVDPHEQLVGLWLTQLMPFLRFPVTDDFRVLMYQAIDD